MRFSLMALLMLISIAAYPVEDYYRQQTQERIKPVGQVRLEGQTRPAAEPAQEETKTETAKEEVPGKATYEQYCAVCHRDGIAGAPKFQSATEWQTRLDKQSMEEMLATAIKGINAMPPKGTCMDCSEEELKHAIQYMLPEK